MKLPERFATLESLVGLPSPSGDECLIADWLSAYIASAAPDAKLVRLGDSLVASRSACPTVAVFAHTDTTGFTLGYDRELIPLGSPAPKAGEILKSVETGEVYKLSARNPLKWRLTRGKGARPGDRFVYATEPSAADGYLNGPYYDNRAGVWAALEALQRCASIAVAFTAGEEHSGVGASVCARYLSEAFALKSAIISDITWHTRNVTCGLGPAISLRDRMVPPQRYLRRVLAAAAESGIKHQIEIESSGGSDGMYIQRSGYPIDWVFVGAPQKDPHTSQEAIYANDLLGMADLISHLVVALSK